MHRDRVWMSCLLFLLAALPGVGPGDPCATDTAHPACGSTDLRREPLAPCFVPNLGQFDAAVRFVHCSTAMNLFLLDRGWLLDLRAADARRGAAVRMTFVGSSGAQPSGERVLPGQHNYFVGAPERWRTGVPRFAAARYQGLYPGVDLQVHDANGVPEYDVLLAAGADLAQVRVKVEGATGMRLADDGSLVVATAAGDLVQPLPRTWEVDAAGRRSPIACRFELHGADEFGFVVQGWRGDTALTIDPGLVWSTYLGGTRYGRAVGVDVNDRGQVAVVGSTASSDFPTTLGAYDTTHNGRVYPSGAVNSDTFVSVLDPSATGSAQLLYSTFLGGRDNDDAAAVTLASNGVVTLVGSTSSSDFPTTAGAYSMALQDLGEFPLTDVYVARLDPAQSGAAQLTFASLLGGVGRDTAHALAVSDQGLITVVGNTEAGGFPTTANAFDRVLGGTEDGFVSRLDPRQTGAAQLVYSSFFGGSKIDQIAALAVDGSGVVTIGGLTTSPDLPISAGAFDSTYAGMATLEADAFVSQLDPNKPASAQLVYSTYLGADRPEFVGALAVGADGVISVTGATYSASFPTTVSAFSRLLYGNMDAFVCRLDPQRSGAAQLLYSTLIGGNTGEHGIAIAVSDDGLLTVAGSTYAADFPTTAGAFQRTLGGATDGFVVRLDPRLSGASQLVHGTYFGGSNNDTLAGLHVDPAGVATIAGTTSSSDLPVSSGAYDPTYNALPSASNSFVARLDLGATLFADRYTLSLSQPGSRQSMAIHPGAVHAGRSYLVVGSATGTTPGITLNGLHVPLNPDAYTTLLVGHGGGVPFVGFRGVLDAQGEASAAFVIPPNVPPSVLGFTVHHAYLVFDSNGTWRSVSPAIPLRLVQ